jgi:hypothetical protein
MIPDQAKKQPLPMANALELIHFGNEIVTYGLIKAVSFR